MHVLKNLDAWKNILEARMERERPYSRLKMLSKFWPEIYEPKTQNPKISQYAFNPVERLQNGLA